MIWYRENSIENIEPVLIRNYIVTAWRMVRRNPLFTLINVSGLAIGLACSLLIFLWVFDEISYDRFHENRKRIFRLNSVFDEEPDRVWNTSPFPLAPALSDTYPFVEAYTRKWQYPAMLHYEEKSHFASGGMLVDPGFFRMFSYLVVDGRPGELLRDRQQIVLTESLSRTMFEGEDPMGKIISIDEMTHLTVMGIMADPPRNSEFQFSFLASIELLPPERLDSPSMDVYSYIMVDRQTSPEEAHDRLAGYYKTVDSTSTGRIVLQPFANIHLREAGNSGLSEYLRLFGSVAILIIVVACINYMNLSTIRSVERAREIAIRKITGASPRAIRSQFYLEPAMITLIALFLAFVLVELFRVPFNTVTGKHILIDYSDPVLWLILGGIYLVTVLLSGLYPAIQSGRYHPVRIMTDRFQGGKGSMRLRSLLVIFQFTVSTLLIIAAITMDRQLRYINQRDAGYDKENLLIVRFGPPFTEQFDLIKQKLLEIPGIVTVTGSSLLPCNVNWEVSLDWSGNKTFEQLPIKYLMVDYDFTETMGMDLVAGRSFSAMFPSDDSVAYIVNESAVKAMQLAEPVGTSITFVHPDFPEQLRKGKIIGVVRDFHAGTFHQMIPPLVIRIYRPWFNYLIVKIIPEEAPAAIAYMERLTGELAPGYPFDYTFFKDEYSELYHPERRMNTLIKLFALLAIAISSFGVLGLSSYAALRRTKEIGIRKVNGASSPAILRILIFNNTRYVFLSVLIAVPAGWLLMSRWLRSYAYQVGLSWWIFVLAGLIALIISLVATAIQVYRKATTNPVKSLRYE